MKKLLFSLMLLLNTNNAWSLDAEEFMKMELSTDKFFKYCIQDRDKLTPYFLSYCIGFYKGLSFGWMMDSEKKASCGIPPFADFSTKFNSLFYRNEIDTNNPTPINIYITLDDWCNSQNK
jgi:hypothetical protein